MKKYIIRNRKAGGVVCADAFATLAEAEKTLYKYELEDRADGTYTPDFYEIIDEDFDTELDVAWRLNVAYCLFGFDFTVYLFEKFIAVEMIKNQLPEGLNVLIRINTIDAFDNEAIRAIEKIIKLLNIECRKYTKKRR